MLLIEPDQPCLCGSGSRWGECCAGQLPLTLRYIPVRLVGPSDPVAVGCQRGGHCCRNVHVPLTPFDVLRLARRRGIFTGALLVDVAAISPDGGVEIDGAPECPFLEDNSCSVYSDRPDACRMYPFWGVTTGESNWLVERHTCEGCWGECRTAVVTASTMLEDARVRVGMEAEQVFQQAIRDLDKPEVSEEDLEAFMLWVYDMDSSCEKLGISPPEGDEEILLAQFRDVVSILKEMRDSTAGDEFWPTPE